MPTRIKKYDGNTKIVVKHKKSSSTGSGHASLVPIHTEIENDKIQRAALSLSTLKDPLIPKNTTAEQVEDKVIDWVKIWLEAGTDNRRMSGRGKKNFIFPTNYIFMPSNATSIDQMNEELSKEEYQNTGKDISDLIIQRLWTYGRRTIDEMVEDFKAIDPNLVIMVVNDMVDKCWLKTVKEKDEKSGEKLKTVELVTKADRTRLLKKKKSKSL